LFSTGKVIVSGLKDFNDAESVITRFKNVIGIR